MNSLARISDLPHEIGGFFFEIWSYRSLFLPIFGQNQANLNKALTYEFHCASLNLTAEDMAEHQPIDRFQKRGEVRRFSGSPKRGNAGLAQYESTSIFKILTDYGEREEKRQGIAAESGLFDE